MENFIKCSLADFCIKEILSVYQKRGAFQKVHNTAT